MQVVRGQKNCATYCLDFFAISQLSRTIYLQACVIGCTYSSHAAVVQRWHLSKASGAVFLHDD